MTVEYENNIKIVDVLTEENKNLIVENKRLLDKLSENEKF